MGVTNRLLFNPTDADTIAASSSVGSYIRAGDDGTLIGHVSDALKVSLANASIAVTATDLDIRDLAFATDSVTAHQGGTWNIGTVGSITGDVSIDDGGNSITVDATDLDIRDLTAVSDSIQSWLRDGAGTALTSTLVGSDQALDVNLVNTIAINDAALANVAIENEAVAVSTSAVAVTASALAARKYLFLANEGNKKGYVGKTGVTTSNGFPLMPGERMELRAGAAVGVFFIGGTGSSNEDFRTMQLS